MTIVHACVRARLFARIPTQTCKDTHVRQKTLHTCIHEDAYAKWLCRVVQSCARAGRFPPLKHVHIYDVDCLLPNRYPSPQVKRQQLAYSINCVWYLWVRQRHFRWEKLI